MEALRGIGSIRPIRWGSRYRREGRSRPFPCALFTARGGGNVRTQTSLLLYTILAYLSTVFSMVFQVCEIHRTLDRLRPPRTGSLHGVRSLSGGRLTPIRPPRTGSLHGVQEDCAGAGNQRNSHSRPVTPPPLTSPSANQSAPRRRLRTGLAAGSRPTP